MRADALPPAPAADAPMPSRRSRVLLAVGAGVLSALVAWLCARRALFSSDFVYPWKAAQILLHGGNPYHALPGGLPEPFQAPLFYPMPTVLATLPVAGLPVAIAAAVMMGLAATVLVYALTRDGLYRAYVCVSAPFAMAVSLGQWSPLVMLAALYPAAGWLATLKPNIGLAVLAYRPTWRGVLSVLAVLAVSFLVLPTWLGDWRAGLAKLEHHPAPILTFPGVLVALALLRWRRAEARFLVAMGCMPQLLFFADQLPLALVARTKNETLALSACGFAAFLGWFLFLRPGDYYVVAAAPWVASFLYLPALVMVLRRPNEGAVPAWLERLAERVRPRWLAGTTP